MKLYRAIKSAELKGVPLFKNKITAKHSATRVQPMRTYSRRTLDRKMGEKFIY
jgi:hypothetical protein